MTLLSSLAGPKDLKRLNHEQLLQLCGEIRSTIIETVSHTGGHLGSSLGVVELTVVLHRLLDSPKDRLVWDTGHQAYAHKLLTGPPRSIRHAAPARRRRRLPAPHRERARRHGRRPRRHRPLGRRGPGAGARRARHSDERIAVVVGDAALMSGLSLEALNDIGHAPHADAHRPQRQRDEHLADGRRLLHVPLAHQAVAHVARLQARLRRLDQEGPRSSARRCSSGRCGCASRSSAFAQPGQLFEDLGITYVGPVPGHSLVALERTFRRALRDMDGPVLVHVRTRKGRGYRPAEADKVSFHGAALPPMTVLEGGDGNTVGPAQAEGDAALSNSQRKDSKKKPPNYTAVLADELIRIGRRRPARGRHHRGHAHRHRPLQVPAGLPDAHVRRRHRRAARRHAGDRPRARRPAPVRGHLLHVPPARLRPDRPRRVPERRARWSSASIAPAWSARTAPATRACSRCRRSASCRTWSSPRRRTSRSCGACCAPPSARTTRSRCTTRATRASTCRPSSRRPSRSARARCCARARTSSSPASARSWRAAWRSPIG